jgi:hypothetical protein
MFRPMKDAAVALPTQSTLMLAAIMRSRERVGQTVARISRSTSARLAAELGNSCPVDNRALRT